MPYSIINGKLVTEQEAVVSVQDRGFRYGDGVFETLAVGGGVPWQFDWHMRRLRDGLRAIRIDCDISNLRDDCRTLLQKNDVQNGLLRIQVTRGAGSRGYWPTVSVPTVVIETAPPPTLPDYPGALWQSAIRKISPQALPVQFKLCQGLNSTLARMEAADHECFDSLLLNESGHICETSSGNIFWLKDKALFTPSLSCGILEGAARAAIMRLSPYPVQEIEAPLEMLLGADAVIITNVVWKALAIGWIMPGNRQFDSAPLAAEIHALLTGDMAGASW